MTEEFLLGNNAKLYYGAKEAVLADLAELDNIKDATLNMTAAETDTTTRGNSGYRSTTGGLKEIELTFQMQVKPTDAAYKAIRDAFLGNTGIELAPLTQDRATIGAEGPRGTWSITGFSRSEPLEGTITVDVTAKIQIFREWVEIE
jgi:hypothetical protein